MQFAILKTEDGEFELSKPVTTIGRTSENDIVFAGDGNISRSHAEIELRDGLYFLIDPGSSNGTKVNDESVKGEVRLTDGDRIVFGGSAKAEFLFGSAAAKTGSEGQPAADAPQAGGADSSMGGNPLSDAGNQIGYQADYAMNQGLYDVGSGIRGNIANAMSPGSAAGSAGTAASTGAATAAETAGVTGAAAAETAAGGGSSTVLVAGVVGGIAVVAMVAAGAYYYTRGASSCGATAKIVSPEQGETLNKPTDVRLDISDQDGCVARAVLMVDQKPVASAEPPNFDATIDPQNFPDLADGDVHDLSVVLFDKNGGEAVQASTVMLAFDTRAVAKPEESKTPQTGPPPPPQNPTLAKVSLLDVQKMSQALVKQFTGGLAYDLSDKQFMQEIQKKTAEYAVPGYTERAAKYRDAINVAFTHEQNLDAPLGFVLAMSRSKFDPAKKGDLAGLWQMSDAFVVDNKYNGSCGTETIADPAQNCAAKACALYMKALVFGVFDSDPVYAAAAFGKAPAEAATWKATFTADRSKIWSNIKTAPEREQLVRFFAAGIVAENPQKFGLANERPLSELYRVTM
ncbi:MAG: FHA domain-containing protein [Acidobacteria bacterium]|nr:FHA domain-containing protein [Acidobacteriota bacterium]